MTAFLNARSHFSIGESLLTPTQIVELGKAAGATSIALTDTMTISGMPELFTACRKHGVKAIIGARLRIVDELTFDRAGKKLNRFYYLRALVQTEEGYHKLLRLLSIAFDEAHFYEVPRLTLTDVASVLAGGGVTVTLGDFYGAESVGKGDAVVAALEMAGIPVVSDLLPLPTPHFTRLTHDAIARKLPMLISVPSFYEKTEHAESLDVMRTVVSNFKLDELTAKHPYGDYTAKRNTDLIDLIAAMGTRLAARYGEDVSIWRGRLARSIKSTVEFPSTVTFDWEKQAPSLPIMAVDEFGEVVRLCKQGWSTRFKSPVFGHTPTNLRPYAERLAYELSVLKKLKFEAYFLLVGEIVNYAKSIGVRVGVGRGSVGGSLVAYLMGITDIDPIRFDLLFERFINPDRIDLPDADLDFMGTRRGEVIDWIEKRFGSEYVAGVSNYLTMAAAGALQGLCRVMDVDTSYNAFSRLVPKEHGVSMSLDEAMGEVPELEQFAAEHPEVIKHARVIEDRMRTYGRHAAGVIVAGVPVRERAVIERRSDAMVINWDKRLAEEFGLVKIDVLGLITLDMIDVTLRQIKENYGLTIEPTDIPIDDGDVLEAFGKGTTVGVFQFESPGMRKLLRDMAKESSLTFDDITAATALYRPGPMDSGLLDLFVKIKQHLVAPSYPHPSMEEALKDTYGVMVYQEEVMAVSRDFAGLTNVQADHLRKAMGKKDKAKMAEWREKFVTGAVTKHGVTDMFAGEIFDQIEKFAGYGFNKSHAAAYTLISYVCMWLKVHYPAEFYSGLLTHVKSDRRHVALAEMSKLGIKIFPPDVNDSTDVFHPLHRNAVLAPFNCIKGISSAAEKAIMEARSTSGRFVDKKDFEERVPGRACNVRHREMLDRVGAFSRIDSTAMPADHYTRRRDQMELMEGLVGEAVVIERPMTFDRFKVDRLRDLIEAYRACDKCELKGLCHPTPHVAGPAKIMLIVDGPTYRDEAADTIGTGGTSEALHEALSHAGLELSDVYITALIKSSKPEKTKEWSGSTLTACPQWLNQEIDLLKPPLIVTLGSLAARHFVDDLKGGVAEHAGRVVYDRKLDCNILIGLNPAMVHFRPEVQTTLNDIFARIPDLVDLSA